MGYCYAFSPGKYNSHEDASITIAIEGLQTFESGGGDLFRTAPATTRVYFYAGLTVFASLFGRTF